MKAIITKSASDRAYRRLANAIVRRAAEDYKEALMTNDFYELEEDCIQFFRSGACERLSGIDGVSLMHNIERYVKKL